MPKSKKRKRSPHRSNSPAAGLPIPDRRGMEGIMAGMGRILEGHDGEPQTPLDRAQELMYHAWDTSGRQRVDLARRALAISPDCADAYVLLAEEAARSLAEARDLYARGVAAGERALGPETFQADAGHFWGILETRPYMRARAGLAECLWSLGEREAAVGHYQDMLRLNPKDNQGIRWILVLCLLMLGRDAEVASLLKQYPDDASATWAYSAALLAFRQQGDTPASRAKLKQAMTVNPHIPAFLLGRKAIPRQLPEYIGFGDESEAVSYAAHSISGWRQTPGALAWLEAAAGFMG